MDNIKTQDTEIHVNEDAVKDILEHTKPLGEDGHAPLTGEIPLSEPLSSQDQAVRDSF